MITSEVIDTLETFRYAYSEKVDFRKLVEKAETWCKEGRIPHHTVQAAHLKRAWTEAKSDLLIQMNPLFRYGSK